MNEFKFCCSGFLAMIFVGTLVLILRMSLPNIHQIDQQMWVELIAFPSNPTADPLLMVLTTFLLIGFCVILSVHGGLRK